MDTDFTQTIAAARAKLSGFKEAIEKPYEELEQFRAELRQLSKEATQLAKGRPSGKGRTRVRKNGGASETQVQPTAVAAE